MGLLVTVSTLLLLVNYACSIVLPAQDGKVDRVQRQWQKLRRAASSLEIQLHVALTQTSEQLWNAEQSALGIADPGHKHYRRHLKPDELQLQFSPGKAYSQPVIDWLGEYGVAGKLRGSLVEASASIADVENLLNTTYYVYSDGVREVTRAENYHVPENLSRLVDFVAPTFQFPPSGPRKAKPSPLDRSKDATASMLTQREESDNDPCSDFFVTPACITKTYNVNYTASPSRVTFAVYGTEAATYKSSDMHTFLKSYNPSAAAANAQFHVIGAGDPNDGSPGMTSTFETALDTQTSLGIAWPATGILYNLGGVFGPSSSTGQTYDPLVQFLQDLIHNDTVPSVVSFSESMPEDVMDPAYAQRLCSMMAQVGMRGVSLLFSSGDNGPNGDQPSGTHKKIFEPGFPASCPWVTSVGGTTNPRNETAATKQTMQGLLPNYIASGGGFSTLFPRPPYQNTAIPPYITTHVPASYTNISGFAPTGRGIPDISALSTHLPVTVAGLTFPVGGTSASTPLWAALVALLNDLEAGRGRPPLGFLNPWLYSLSSTGALRDITTGGDSAGECFALEGCTLSRTYGYDVVAGWDPVTGLGVPDFGGLVENLP